MDKLKELPTEEKTMAYLIEHLKRHSKNPNNLKIREQINSHNANASRGHITYREITSVLYAHPSYQDIFLNTLAEDKEFIDYFDLINSFKKSTHHSKKIVNPDKFLNTHPKTRTAYAVNIVMYGKTDKWVEHNIEPYLHYFSLWIVFNKKKL